MPYDWTDADKKLLETGWRNRTSSQPCPDPECKREGGRAVLHNEAQANGDPKTSVALKCSRCGQMVDFLK